MRNILLAIVIIVGLVFLAQQVERFESLVDVLRRGNPFWIGLAFVVQWAWLVNTAAQYRAAYRALDLHVSHRSLLPLVLASNFVNTVAPSGGMSGMAVFIDDARKRGLPTMRVTLAGVLFVLFEYTSFSVVLALGLIVLMRRNDLDSTEVIPSVILFAAAIALTAVVVLGMYSAQALERFLISAARLVNRLLRPFIHRDYLSEPFAHEFATEAAIGFSLLKAKPKDAWLMPFALALSGKSLLVSLLFLLFLAFEQPFSVGTITAGYSMAFLFTIVSPTPMGIGFVESAMTLTLRTLRVPLAAATVIALTYRGMTLWLPLLYGFIALQLGGLRRR